MSKKNYENKGIEVIKENTASIQYEYRTNGGHKDFSEDEFLYATGFGQGVTQGLAAGVCITGATVLGVTLVMSIPDIIDTIKYRRRQKKLIKEAIKDNN